MIPTQGDIGHPYYEARTSLNTLALLDATKGNGMRQSGLAPVAIARYLGVSDKTVTKAIVWIQGKVAD